MFNKKSIIQIGIRLNDMNNKLDKILEKINANIVTSNNPKFTTLNDTSFITPHEIKLTKSKDNLPFIINSDDNKNISEFKKSKLKKMFAPLTPSEKLTSQLETFKLDQSQKFKICLANNAKNNKNEFTVNLLLNTSKKKLSGKEFSSEFIAKNKKVSKKNATHIKITRIH